MESKMVVSLGCAQVDVRFGALHALKSISIGFEAGKIHALLGQNGAGKSTLARVLSGLAIPDSGTLEICGNTVETGVPVAAQAAGLDIVHQRFTLPPTFTVAEALEFASARKMGGTFYKAGSIRNGWGEKMRAAGINTDPDAKLADVPVETAQALEILRALSNDAKVLILDEPTALLSLPAIDALFDQLRHLRDQGVTLIVILHKLREVMALADTVSVLREGALTLPPTPKSELTTAQISDFMIGEAIVETMAPVRTEKPDQPEVLRFDAVSSAKIGVEPGLSDLSFSLSGGQILGIAGVEGNGQRQLAEVLCAMSPTTSGQITLLGENITSATTQMRRDKGVRAVPFDRMTEGAGLTLPLWENMQSWRAEAFQKGRWPFVSTKKMRQAASEALESFEVVFGSVQQEGGSLSGGNLQRLILAREFSKGVKLVIAAQPTRGLDFKATDFVWSELNRLRSEGAAIILISSDLEELFAISDQVMVLRDGTNAGQFSKPFELRSIGDAMVGATR